MKKNTIKICALICGVLGIVFWYNNYMSYKKLQCIDHNTKGYILRVVTLNGQRRNDAQLEALTTSDYSLVFGCRFYEHGKLTKFVYDYPMTDEVFWADYDATIERIKAHNKNH